MQFGDLKSSMEINHEQKYATDGYGISLFQ